MHSFEADVGEFIAGVTSLRRQQEPFYPRKEGATIPSFVKRSTKQRCEEPCLGWGLEGSARFGNTSHLMFALPGAKLCLPVLFFRWVIIRELVSRQMLNLLLLHLAFQNNE